MTGKRCTASRKLLAGQSRAPRASNAIRIFSTENRRRVLRRISRTAFSAVTFFPVDSSSFRGPNPYPVCPICPDSVDGSHSNAPLDFRSADARSQTEASLFVGTDPLSPRAAPSQLPRPRLLPEMGSIDSSWPSWTLVVPGGDMQRALIALTVTLPAISALAGVSADWPSTAGARFRIDAPLQSVDALTRDCRPRRKGVCEGGGATEERCRIEEVRELGVFGDTQHLLVRSRRERSFAGQGETEPYTCASEELALLEMPEPGRARVIWEDATEPEFVSLGSSRLVSTADGRSILSLLYCLSGTGGCAEGLLLWNGRHWMPLMRDASWEWPISLLPKGHVPHKSPRLDLARMTHEWHIAGPRDANCCPSGRAYLELALDPEALALTGYRIFTHEADAAVERLRTRSGSELHPSLPAEPLADWLRRTVPGSSVVRWERNDCGEASGDPARDEGRELPGCVSVHVQAFARDREVVLLFDATDGAFRFATARSPGGRLRSGLEHPGDLTRLLGEPILLEPIRCPEGSVRRERPSQAGLFEWCEDAAGRRQGPARSWFSTGLYLMERGQWRDGAPAGLWIECDRFERCRRRDRSAATPVTP